MAGSKDSVEEPQGVSMLYCIGVSLSYAAVSVAITFVNKIVLSVYEFEFEQTLILAQLLVGSLAIYFLSILGVCRIPTFDLQVAFKALPLSIWFFLYVVTGLGSLRSLTVPTWSALRRLTALCILGLDAFVDARPAPIRVWLSVACMILGAVLAAAGDIDGDVWGYAHVGCNCFSSAMYLRAVGAVKKDTGLSEVGVLYYANLLSLPLVAAAVAGTGEAVAVLRFPFLDDAGFLLWAGASAAMAGLLNYLVFLSATVNSPLTTSIVGQAKNVVGSLGGLVLMPTAAGRDPVHLLGLLVGVSASVWYGVLKYKAWPARGSP